MVRQVGDEGTEIGHHANEFLESCPILGWIDLFDGCNTRWVGVYTMLIVDHPKELYLWGFDRTLRAIEHQAILVGGVHQFMKIFVMFCLSRAKDNSVVCNADCTRTTLEKLVHA